MATYDLNDVPYAVLDQDHSGIALVGHPADDRQQGLDDDRGQAHAHLVDEQHFRRLDQGSSDGEHLLLAPGELTHS